MFKEIFHSIKEKIPFFLQEFKLILCIFSFIVVLEILITAICQNIIDWTLTIDVLFVIYSVVLGISCLVWADRNSIKIK